MSGWPLSVIWDGLYIAWVELWSGEERRGEECYMTGALGLEKLLDFSIILVKPFSIVPRREAAFLLSSYLENGFQLLA